MTAPELLSQLKDIHPPAEPGWWPLAPTLYVLVAVVLFLSWAIWAFVKRRAAKRLHNHALRELQIIKQGFHSNGDRLRLGLKLSDWLKRVALSAFPDKQIEGLTGRPWLQFLDQCIGTHEFTEGSGEFFGGAVYGRSPNLLDGRVIELCERWLISIRPKLAPAEDGKC